VNDDPNSIATTFTRVLFATTDAEVVDPASVLAALAAAGWEVNPAGTADRLAALTDAIDDAVRSIRGDHYEDPSIRTLCVLCGAADGSYPCTALMEADALAAAVQPPDPNEQPPA
jgi:hypothetical protein